MRAIILAAGKGNRLRPFTDESHKCLLQFGGKTLIRRYLDDFAELGIKKATVVLGHKMDMVRDHLSTYDGPVHVEFLVNEAYQRGSILSVATASEHFDDDILMMDCDVLYHPELLDLLVNSKNNSSYLMDTSYTDTGEECKVAAMKGRVVANNRTIHVPYDAIGEGLGLLKLSHETAQRYRTHLLQFVERGDIDCEYENPLELLLQEAVVGYELIGDLPWTEIDFAEDIEKARSKVLPAIESYLGKGSS